MGRRGAPRSLGLLSCDWWLSLLLADGAFR